jgi:hypothetical protein
MMKFIKVLLLITLILFQGRHGFLPSLNKKSLKYFWTADFQNTKLRVTINEQHFPIFKLFGQACKVMPLNLVCDLSHSPKHQIPSPMNQYDEKQIEIKGNYPLQANDFEQSNIVDQYSLLHVNIYRSDCMKELGFLFTYNTPYKLPYLDNKAKYFKHGPYFYNGELVALVIVTYLAEMEEFAKFIQVLKNQKVPTYAGLMDVQTQVLNLRMNTDFIAFSNEAIPVNFDCSENSNNDYALCLPKSILTMLACTEINEKVTLLKLQVINTIIQVFVNREGNPRCDMFSGLNSEVIKVFEQKEILQNHEAEFNQIIFLKDSILFDFQQDDDKKNNFLTSNNGIPSCINYTREEERDGGDDNTNQSNYICYYYYDLDSDSKILNISLEELNDNDTTSYLIKTKTRSTLFEVKLKATWENPKEYKTNLFKFGLEMTQKKHPLFILDIGLYFETADILSKFSQIKLFNNKILMCVLSSNVSDSEYIVTDAHLACDDEEEELELNETDLYSFSIENIEGKWEVSIKTNIYSSAYTGYIVLDKNEVDVINLLPYLGEQANEDY